MKKVLIITYYWPPSGGSGVQRWLKYVKYLVDFGIEPIVLTVDPLDAIYPNEDKSLLKDLSPNTEIHFSHAKSPLKSYQKIRNKPAPKSGFAGEADPTVMDTLFRFIRGNFFIPDARKGWNKNAIKSAKKIILENSIDTIITTSPPHSTQLIGLKLKQDLQINWICDLRDPWTELFYNKSMYQTALAKKIDKTYERKCLDAADEIIVVSQNISNNFVSKYPRTETKINIIPNGYDPEDFEFLKTSPSETKYISYIGSLGEEYPIEKFILSFQKLCQQESNWKLRFVGNISEKTINLIKKYALESFVEIIDYKPHKEAVELMFSSDVLLLIIPEIKENKGILTGKLFEYIASENSIIFIGPKDGDAAKIVSEINNASVHNYNEELDLLRITKDILNRNIDPKIKLKYSRIEQTKEIAELIKK